MIVIDTSALIAVLRGESDAAALLIILNEADSIQLSAATYVETSIVIDSSGDPVLSARFDELLAELEVAIVDVTTDQAVRARRAYSDYGKGSGHPAQLNYGDCFSYALATQTRTPLLFKGSDFGHTDVQSVRQLADTDSRHAADDLGYSSNGMDSPGKSSMSSS